MKKHLVSASLVCAVALGAGLPSSADDAVIKVRNVSPQLVAWWLDPAHQKLPVVVQAVRTAVGPEWLDVRMPQETMFTLPAGIEKLAINEPHNDVVATGTAGALAELRKQIAALDRPLRQVEIESFLVAMDADAVKKFGIDFKPIAAMTKPGTEDAFPLLAGKAATSFRKTLTDLETAKQAQVMGAPRLTAIDWLPASIVTEQATPLALPATAGGLFKEFNLYTTARIGIASLPMIQEDGTIRLRFSPTLARGLVISADPEKPLTTEPYKGRWVSLGLPQAVVTMDLRDRETMALTGFMPRGEASGKDGAKATPSREYVCFVTARIVRRMEDRVPAKSAPQGP